MLLETLWDATRFHGTCYRAANSIHIGQTEGRGRLDVHQQFALPAKHIPLKPIHPCWRSILLRRISHPQSDRIQRYGTVNT